VRALAEAGVAVEAMLMTGFPGETRADRKATLDLLVALEPWLSLFMVSEHGIVPGSRVAREPARYGLKAVYAVQGDELGTTLFSDPPAPPTEPDIEEQLGRLASLFRMRSYPWAGSLSTAHSLLYYDRFGPRAFRHSPQERRAPWGAPAKHEHSEKPRFGASHGRRQHFQGRYNLATLTRTAHAHEAGIWDALLTNREVSRHAYEQLASSLPVMRPRHDALARSVHRTQRPQGRRRR